MKKSILIASIAALSVTAPLSSFAQFVVKIRPAPVVVVERPAAPSPTHVWVEGEWRWDKRRHEYVAVPGYWVRPKRGRAWVPGHWAEVPGGSTWIRGHWARR